MGMMGSANVWILIRENINYGTRSMCKNQSASRKIPIIAMSSL
jgi:hypothetical protein